MAGAFEVRTKDGLTLRGKHYAPAERSGKTPALCLPGLTRNDQDFEDFAPEIAATGRDVYALSFRGRGPSDYDPDYLNYHPLTYRQDVLDALDALGIDSAVFVGTSLGGIVTMLTAMAAPARIAAAIINDVGTELAPEGIARIAGYVGAAATTPTPAANLDEAAARIRAINEVAFPGRDDDFWRTFARRTFRQNGDGAWRLDYDTRVGKALLEVGPAPDLTPAFASLAPVKTLVVRGALSDLLSMEIVDKMRTINPAFEYAEVSNVGHAPTLTEPDALGPIRNFLQSVN